jgi:hypothetical protein
VGALAETLEELRCDRVVAINPTSVNAIRHAQTRGRLFRIASVPWNRVAAFLNPCWRVRIVSTSGDYSLEMK